MYSLLIQANGTSLNTKKNSKKIRKILRKTGFLEVKSPFPTMSRTLFVVRRRDGVGWQLVCCWCFPFLTRSTLADILLIHSAKWKQACRDRKMKKLNCTMIVCLRLEKWRKLRYLPRICKRITKHCQRHSGPRLSARVTSVKATKLLSASQLERLGPIDRTPGTPGSGKRIL